MNFLAHLYLSPENDHIKLGNFIADEIKGNKYLDFPDDVQKGILIHREIDDFTDKHSFFRKSKSRITKKYGLFSGIIIDIFYDHFLAKNWNDYSETELKDFVKHAHAILIKNFKLLPPRSRRILPFLVTQNWLVGYKDFNELKRVFYGMDRRTGNRSGMRNAVDDLQEHYEEFESDFFRFFPEIKQHIGDSSRFL